MRIQGEQATNVTLPPWKQHADEGAADNFGGAICAALVGNVAEVKLLVEHGADGGARNNGVTALMGAEVAM